MVAPVVSSGVKCLLHDRPKLGKVTAEKVTAPVKACTESWNSAAVTDVGQVRQLNEDAFLDRPDLGLWAVADGMGGHSSGDVASDMLCTALSALPPHCPLSAAVDFIDSCAEKVNDQLLTMASERNAGGVIGCTLVALVARGPHAVFLWAGDSRLYRLRDGQLEQLTDDHSLVEEARGRVADPSQINSNIITRAVGADQQLVLELESALLEEGDRFLLCSDGLNRDLDDAGIARLMAVGVPASASAGLVAQAVRAGGGDNITALIADYGCSAGTDP